MMLLYRYHTARNGMLGGGFYFCLFFIKHGGKEFVFCYVLIRCYRMCARWIDHHKRVLILHMNIGRSEASDGSVFPKWSIVEAEVPEIWPSRRMKRKCVCSTRIILVRRAGTLSYRNKCQGSGSPVGPSLVWWGTSVAGVFCQENIAHLQPPKDFQPPLWWELWLY